MLRSELESILLFQLRIDRAVTVNQTRIPVILFRRTVQLSICLLTTLLFCNCVHRDFPVIRPVDHNSAKYESLAKAENYFLVARELDRGGASSFAQKYYEKAYALDPSSNTLQNLLFQSYFQTSNFTQALLLIKGNKSIIQLSDDEKRQCAQVYAKLGKLQRAVEVLDSVEKKEPGELYTLALLNESLGKHSKAVAYFRDFYKRNTDNTQAGLSLADFYIKSRMFADAESLYVALAGQFGNKPEYLNGLGVVRLLQKDTISAQNFFSMALAIDSTFHDALYNIAQLFLSRQEYKSSIPYYERLASDSTDGDGYLRALALVYYYSDEHKKAQILFRKLLEKNIDDFELHYFLGMTIAELDSSDLAVLEFEKAVTLNPEFKEAWQQLCYFFIRQKNWTAATNVAMRFTRALPANSVSWRTAASVASSNKVYDEAIRFLHRALFVDSTDFYSWFELGSALEQLGRIDSAAIVFKRALLLRPDDPVVSNYLGYMWAEHDMHLDSARVLLKSTLKQEPDNGAYLDSYAWILYKLGDYDGAAVIMDRAIKKIDNDPVIFLHWGEILSSQHRCSEAIAAFKKYLKIGGDKVDSVQVKIDQLQKQQISKKPNQCVDPK